LQIEWDHRESFENDSETTGWRAEYVVGRERVKAMTQVNDK
jgi:hypothetical protein